MSVLTHSTNSQSLHDQSTTDHILAAALVANAASEPPPHLSHSVQEVNTPSLSSSALTNDESSLIWHCPFTCGQGPYQRSSRRTIKTHMTECLKKHYPHVAHLNDNAIPEVLLEFDAALYFVLRDAFLLPRTQKTRRNVQCLERYERWTCPFQCGQQYRVTSTKSIKAHMDTPEHQCDNQKKGLVRRDDTVNRHCTYKRKSDRAETEANRRKFSRYRHSAEQVLKRQSHHLNSAGAQGGDQSAADDEANIIDSLTSSSSATAQSIAEHQLAIQTAQQQQEQTQTKAKQQSQVSNLATMRVTTPQPPVPSSHAWPQVPQHHQQQQQQQQQPSSMHIHIDTATAAAALAAANTTNSTVVHKPKLRIRIDDIHEDSVDDLQCDLDVHGTTLLDFAQIGGTGNSSQQGHLHGLASVLGGNGATANTNASQIHHLGGMQLLPNCGILTNLSTMRSSGMASLTGLTSELDYDTDFGSMLVGGGGGGGGAPGTQGAHASSVSGQQTNLSSLASGYGTFNTASSMQSHNNAPTSALGNLVSSGCGGASNACSSSSNMASTHSIAASTVQNTPSFTAGSPQHRTEDTTEDSHNNNNNNNNNSLTDTDASTTTTGVAAQAITNSMLSTASTVGSLLSDAGSEFMLPMSSHLSAGTSALSMDDSMTSSSSFLLPSGAYGGLMDQQQLHASKLSRPMWSSINAAPASQHHHNNNNKSMLMQQQQQQQHAHHMTNNQHHAKDQLSSSSLQQQQLVNGLIAPQQQQHQSKRASFSQQVIVPQHQQQVQQQQQQQIVVQPQMQQQQHSQSASSMTHNAKLQLQRLADLEAISRMSAALHQQQQQHLSRLMQRQASQLMLASSSSIGQSSAGLSIVGGYEYAPSHASSNAIVGQFNHHHNHIPSVANLSIKRQSV